MHAGLVVSAAFISPFKQEQALTRQMARSDNFVEIRVNTPLAAYEQRDVKGVFKLARTGQIPNMTGVNSQYEAAEAPDCAIGTSSQPLDLLVKRLTTQVLDLKPPRKSVPVERKEFQLLESLHEEIMIH